VEQIERAGRYLARVRSIYGGVFASSHEQISYEDDLVSFFIHCHHIRDWVLHLYPEKVASRTLDIFIDSHTDLRVCADMCNGVKHCVLTRAPRSGSQPNVATKAYTASTWFTGSGGGEVLQARYTIATSAGPRDALELAEDCMKLWLSFISACEIQPSTDQKWTE